MLCKRNGADPQFKLVPGVEMRGDAPQIQQHKPAARSGTVTSIRFVAKIYDTILTTLTIDIRIRAKIAVLNLPGKSRKFGLQLLPFFHKAS
jgi:hypothetical protein